MRRLGLLMEVMLENFACVHLSSIEREPQNTCRLGRQVLEMAQPSQPMQVGSTLLLLMCSCSLSDSTTRPSLGVCALRPMTTLAVQGLDLSAWMWSQLKLLEISKMMSELMVLCSRHSCSCLLARLLVWQPFFMLQTLSRRLSAMHVSNRKTMMGSLVLCRGIQEGVRLAW